jgi:gas vesicle protein
MTTEPAATDTMPDVPANRDRNYGFVMGLIAGSVVGVGLGMIFAPRAVLELRKRASDSARSLGNAASDRYHQASTRIADAVDEIAKKGQGLRDDLSDAVVRGAQDVERYATNAKTGH